jgi:hypothetical protein
MSEKCYPSTRYHRTLPPVRVEDPAHEAEIAPAGEWAETPAAFLADIAEVEDATDDLPAAFLADIAEVEDATDDLPAQPAPKRKR